MLVNKKILVHWYKHNQGYGNFGDELNPYLISRLTKSEIIYFPQEYLDKNNWYILRKLLGKLRYRIIKIRDLSKSLEYIILTKPLYVIIGSVISWYKKNNVIVWGAGIMYKDEIIHKANFLAVRGKYTAKRIKELGFNAPDIFGDPALLMPLIYKPKNINIKYKYLVIPHVTQYESTRYLFKDCDYVEVVDLCENIEEIIDKINSSKFILSSSLHGIIIAHAYNIKAVWVNFTEIEINGDNIKFRDYFSSLDIPEYTSKRILNMEDFNNFIKNSYEELQPTKTKIYETQRELLKVCPFKHDL